MDLINEKQDCSNSIPGGLHLPGNPADHQTNNALGERLHFRSCPGSFRLALKGLPKIRVIP
jgi:hypothetical protein